MAAINLKTRLRPVGPAPRREYLQGFKVVYEGLVEGRLFFIPILLVSGIA